MIIPAACILSQTGCRQNKFTAKAPEKGFQIFIQPFSDMDPAHTEFVYKEIQKFYPRISIANSIELPTAAFYAPRNRYRADSIISILDRKANAGEVVLGLTGKDISCSKNQVKDWGVMGLGYCPGKACVASSFRLSKENKKIQLFRVAIHELGHTQGLAHCPEKSCFMRNANGGNPTGEEKAFCSSCKKTLKGRGWIFND